jgi:hypothetical protein
MGSSVFVVIAVVCMQIGLQCQTNSFGFWGNRSSLHENWFATSGKLFGWLILFAVFVRFYNKHTENRHKFPRSQMVGVSHKTIQVVIQELHGAPIQIFAHPLTQPLCWR